MSPKSGAPGSLSVMVNFMCQLDWTTGCPDIWLNIILSVSVRVFLDEINIWVGRLSKQTALPNVDVPHAFNWRHEQNKRLDKRELLLSNSWSLPASDSDETSGLPWSWACQISDWNLHQLFLILRSLTGTTYCLSWVSRCWLHIVGLLKTQEIHWVRTLGGGPSNLF